MMNIKKLNEELKQILNEGACDQFTTATDLSKEGIKQAFQDRVDRDRDEYGNDSYNGSFTTFSGLKFTDKVFNNYGVAKKWVLDHQEKGGPAFVVTIENNEDSWRKGETFALIGGWAAS